MLADGPQVLAISDDDPFGTRRDGRSDDVVVLGILDQRSRQTGIPLLMSSNYSGGLPSATHQQALRKPTATTRPASSR
jgi:hypothetical protein